MGNSDWLPISEVTDLMTISIRDNLKLVNPMQKLRNFRSVIFMKKRNMTPIVILTSMDVNRASI